MELTQVQQASAVSAFPFYLELSSASFGTSVQQLVWYHSLQWLHSTIGVISGMRQVQYSGMKSSDFTTPTFLLGFRDGNMVMCPCLGKYTDASS